MPRKKKDDGKKKYCFDYIKEHVMKWNDFYKKSMTKQMIYDIPFYISLPYMVPGEPYIPPKDYYGEVVDDINEWMAQREKYIEKLYKKLKKDFVKQFGENGSNQ